MNTLTDELAALYRLARAMKPVDVVGLVQTIDAVRELCTTLAAEYRAAGQEVTAEQFDVVNLRLGTQILGVVRIRTDGLADQPPAERPPAPPAKKGGAK